MPTVEVGGVDGDLPVEAARAQQRRVEHVGTVGRGDQDHAATDVEAVHLDEQLVEGLLALVVTATHAGAAVATDRVDLVDEDDGRSVLLGLLEQVADAAGADADEHLDEVRAGDRVERHGRLAGDGAGQQRLAGAGRAVQQDALGDLGTDGLELGGLLEELLDLPELLDRLFTAGDVGERRLRHVLGDQLGLGLGELHDSAATTLGLVHQEDEEQHDQREREQGHEQGAEEAGLRVLGVGLLDRARVERRVHLLQQQGLLPHDVVGRHLVAALAGAVVKGGLDLLITVDEGDLLDLAVLDPRAELRGLDLVVPAVGCEVLDGQQDAEHGQHHPQPGALEYALHLHLSPGVVRSDATLPRRVDPVV